MDNLLEEIRNAVRALIVREGKILVLKKTDGTHSLPGGAHNVDETLEQGLMRECMEEIGTSVDIHYLAHVGDYFKPKRTQPPCTRHNVEFLFVCSVADDYVAQSGNKPDKRQVEVVWLDIDKLEQHKLVPASLIKPIRELDSENPVYLGVMKHQ